MKKIIKTIAALALTIAVCAGCSQSAKPNTVFSVADLDNKSIGVQLGTTGDIYASAIEAQPLKDTRTAPTLFRLSSRAKLTL